MLIAVGTDEALAIPERARNAMNCAAFLDRPAAKKQMICKNNPAKYMRLVPTTSAIDPNRSSVQPELAELIAVGLQIVRTLSINFMS